MPNNEPVAVLELSKTEITLPENKISASLEKSYDVDKDGNPVERKDMTYLFDSPDAESITTPTAKTTEIIFPNSTEKQQYDVFGTVYDNRGEFNTAKKTVIVNPAPVVTKTLFGAKFQDLNKSETVEMCKQFGVGITRIGITVEGFSPASAPNFDEFINADLPLCLNLSWQTPVSGVSRQFAGDTVDYKYLLTRIFEHYGAKLRDIKKWLFVIENEPTNDAYFGAEPIEKYIDQLYAASEIGQKFGLTMADGCTHIGYLELLRKNYGEVPSSISAKQKANVLQVKQIITAIKDMPGITHCNFHHEFNSSTPPRLIYNAGKFLKDWTGKRILSNEFSCDHVTQEVLKTGVDEMKELECDYAIIWGGDGWDGQHEGIGGNSSADAIQRGMNITTVGQWYIDAIK